MLLTTDDVSASLAGKSADELRNMIEAAIVKTAAIRSSY